MRVIFHHIHMSHPHPRRRDHTSSLGFIGSPLIILPTAMFLHTASIQTSLTTKHYLLAVTNCHKLSGLKAKINSLSYLSGGWKSVKGLNGLKARFRQSCVPSWEHQRIARFPAFSSLYRLFLGSRLPDHFHSNNGQWSLSLTV